MPNTSISFPASPAVNQQYTYGTTTYVYTGTNWAVYVSSPSLPSFVTSANIVDGTIVNADINASAAIDGSKISPVFTSASTFSSTLGVTGIATFAAGSTALPALTTTGDTNTGVYFPAADEVAITAGGTTVLNASSSMGFKNRLINGDMRIDQRNEGGFITITASGNFSVDRWQGFSTPTSKFKLQRSTTTPPPGFTHSMLATCTATQPTLGSTDLFVVTQFIEGFNIGDFNWGTANAATVTISFWVRSSLTGLFGGTVRNGPSPNRTYPFSYTINSSNTWEKKTITIPGDTTGTWFVDNSVTLGLAFGLGVGTAYIGTSGAWVAGNLLSSTSTVNLMATASATWEVTGVQLEKGSVATSFDYRPYSTELALCYRWYYKIKNSTTILPLSTSGQCSSGIGWFALIKFPVIMRVRPTALQTTGVVTDYSVLNAGTSSVVVSNGPFWNSYTSDSHGGVDGSVASGLVAGNATTLGNNTVNAYLAWSTEA